MKKLPENRRRGTTRRIAVAVTALALVGLVAAGAATAWSRLHAMWIGLSPRISAMAEQYWALARISE